MPLDQLGAMYCLALLDLVPGLVADRGQGRMCYQVPAFPVIELAAAFMGNEEKRKQQLTDTH